MSDEVFVAVAVTNSKGQEVGRATVSAPGFHVFSDLPADTYTVTFTPPKDLELVTPSPQVYPLTDYKNDLKIFTDVRSKSIVDGVKAQVVPVGHPPPRPPWREIVIAGASLFILGNCQQIKEALSSADYRQAPRATRVSRTVRQSKPREFSSEVEAGLRECLKENYKSIASDLLNVPSLSASGIVTSTIEEEFQQEEAITQIIQSRDALLQLKDTFESCDPSLLLEIVSIEDDIAPVYLSEPIVQHKHTQNIAMIVGENVNVRELPNVDSEVIAQISNDLILIDTETYMSLTDLQRNEIASGHGWQPVILSDGRRGYVHSRYISRETYYELP